MTGPSNRIMDDFAKLFTDAAGAAQGVRREMETVVRSQAERFLNSMDVVQREEFEAVREMAAKARVENEALAARVAALEAKLGAQYPADQPATGQSSAAESVIPLDDKTGGDNVFPPSGKPTGEI